MVSILKSALKSALESAWNLPYRPGNKKIMVSRNLRQAHLLEVGLT